MTDSQPSSWVSEPTPRQPRLARHRRLALLITTDIACVVGLLSAASVLRSALG